MSRSRAKGTSAESAVVECLRANGFPYAERRALNGASDRGDVAGIPGVVIEVKDCTKKELAGWLDEARKEAVNAAATVYACWFKRRGKGDPKRWFVLLDGEVFMALLRDES